MSNFYLTSFFTFLKINGQRTCLFLRLPLALMCLVLVSSTTTRAQLAVTQNANTQSLAQLLAGPGVTISNYTKTCDNNASGTFTNTGTNIGLSQGVVLSTGKVQNIAQSAINFASSQFNTSTDAQLSTLTTGTVFDKCILEFDITPQGSTLKFDYVFASEEYPQFVCSPYNDVFGFFITGPNPSGGNYTNKNLATLPNSNLPVCINSVNGGSSGTYLGNTWSTGNCISLSNTSYFVDNQNPINPNIVFDGMTTTLTAIATVVPCQTYHLKIAIADVGDRIYDSGVFLQAYSFTSTPYSVAITSQLNYPGYTSAYEGCVGGSYTVSLSSAQSTDVQVDLQITGTATMGLDYDSMPTSVIIHAGQTSVTFPMTPLQDNITESPETVTVAVLNVCSGLPASSASITITDDPTPSITAADTTLCKGQSTQLTVSGGGTYSWSPAGSLSSSTISNPVATPTATTTYTASITLGSCVTTRSEKIYVSNPSVSISAAPSDTICTGGTVQLNATASGGVSPYVYLWNNGNTTTSITATANGTYSIAATDAYGCTANAANNIIISSLAVSGTATPVGCFHNNNGVISLTITGSNLPCTYTWNDGVTTKNRSNLAGGIYAVTVTNSVNCTATALFTVPQPSAALTATPVPNPVTCNTGNDGSINLTVAGGVQPYNYSWSNSDTLQNIAHLSAGPYSVTVTDLGGCSVTANTTVTQPAALAASLVHTDVKCYSGNNGSIQLTVSGGVSPYTYNWSNSSTTQNISNLATGNYTVTAKDNNGCTVNNSASISQPTAINTVLTPVNPGCSGSTGSVNLTVSGGLPNYTYLWTNNATTQNISGVAGGTYGVTVTDINGCTTSNSAIVTPPGSLGVTAAKTNVSCNGGNDGTITLGITGGSTPYTYNWNGGSNAAGRVNLTAGTYTVTITDINSCSATISSTITQPTSINLSLSAINATCFGFSDGKINVTITGGNPGYTYNWGGGVTTQNRINLSAGNYSVTVSDSSLCTATGSLTISQPATAVGASASVTNISCSGGTNGAINITATGGTSPYSYNWGGGVITQNRNNLSAGSYTVTITDANLCTVATTGTISQPSAALNISANQTNVSCNGGNNGSISLFVTGGTSPYLYNWSGGGASAGKTNLTAASYSVTVTDQGSCTASITNTISQPTALNISLAATNVSCFGSATGTINTSVTGGAGGYTYNWGGGVTTQNRINLAAGNYQVTATDANLCTVTGSASITQPATLLNVSASVTNITCFGSNNGTINISATGGNPSYSFNWGGGITTQNRTNLIAGNYTVTVTDANLCTAAASGTITQPSAPMNISAAATNVSCNGGNNGAITLTVTGGNLPYTYNWNGGATTASRANLTANSYTVTVTDQTTCTASITQTITQPSVLNLSLAATNVTCFGAGNGTINATISGGTSGYRFNWGGGITTQNRANLTAGSYQVTATDANLCTVTGSASITQPSTTLAATASVTNISCYGNNNGTVNVSVTGGNSPYLYNWGGGITTQNRSNLAAGTYTTTVTDANLCTVAASGTITQPVTGVNLAPSISNVSCNGGNNGSVALNVSGGTTPYTCTWSNGSKSQTGINLTSGSYSVTVFDSKGCSVKSSFTVTEPKAISVANNLHNISCNGGNDGSIKLSISGGTLPYRCKWNTGSVALSLTHAVAGSYSIQVSDSNNCSASGSYSLSEPQPLQASIKTTNVGCNGTKTGSIKITATGGTGGYNYLWSNQSTSPTLSNLPAGNYSLTITDGNSCTATATQIISEPLAFSLNETHTNELCHGAATGSIQLNATGGTGKLSYQWSNAANSPQLSGLKAGDYTLTLTDANSCTTTTQITISEPPVIQFSEIHTNILCNGASTGSISVTAVGGVPAYHYTWSNGASASKLSNLPAGSYSVTVSDANGCLASLSSIPVIEPTAINTTVNTADIKCYGQNTGKADVSVTGGAAPYKYQWNNYNTKQVLKNVGAGSYTITITDANGCTTAATAAIHSAAPMSTEANPGPVNCSSAFGEINLAVNNGQPPYKYKWNTGATTQNLDHIHPGTYSVTVYDANNCATDTSFTLANLSNFGVRAGGGGTITLGDTIGITATTTGSAQTTFNWTPDNTLRCGNCANTIAQPGESTLYTVVATDTNGCVAQDTVSITVIEDHNYWVPNAFTPNSDGNNDYFQLYGNLPGIRNFKVLIFDRWGEKVFESSESTFKWDGIYKGAVLPPGVYVYLMTLVYLDAQEKEHKGSITLIR